VSSKRNHHQSEGFNLGDIYFVIFRQKWIILGGFVAGLLAVAALFIIKPAQYESEAQLLVRYVMDKTLSSTDNDMSMRSPERGDTIMDTEIAIMTSPDLAQQVVEDVGASNILATVGGGNNTNSAAQVILKNLTIDPVTRGSILHVTYRSSDPDVAQSVLREIIRDYYKKHAQMHQAAGVFGEFLTAETKRLRTELDETEKKLREARNNAGIISLDEAKKSTIEQMTKVREDILNAEAELAEHRAMLGNPATAPPATATGNADTNAVGDIPVVKIKEYKNICLRLAQDNKEEQDYIFVRQYREDSMYVIGIRDQIAKDEAARKQLEQEYPKLALIPIVVAPASGQAVTGGLDLAAESARVRMLEGKTNRLHAQLDQIRAEAGKLDDVEGPIQELQRQKDLKEANLRHFLSSLEQNRIDEELGMGKNSGEISVIANPTSAVKKHTKTFKKYLGIAMGGCFGGGIALAFLIEMFLDHTVRRPADIEKKLKLPLFVSIPNINADGRNHVAHVNGQAQILLNENNGEGLVTTNGNGAPAGGGIAEIPPWDPSHPLGRFYAGLRERLIVNFEVRNLTHNPKLVAVTSCGKGAGVSSIAAGLAASLSETGDGNVLLVDMNMEQHTAQQFYKGKPGCGLDAALEAETMNNAMISENLYVASETGDGNGSTTKVMPKRFASLIPKLKASDYDYIIFDMPPVSQTSMTPRLAGLMDMVLLVIESEKTSREAVQRANALLAESKANVSTVLNKTRSYVPNRLHQEYLNDV
jgi:succinoglycan biosynthesis transport protein ExoP